MARTSPTYDLATERFDRPPGGPAPSATVAVCSHPRSGSTLLGEALTFAGGLGCPLEYFHRGFRPSFEQRWGVRARPDFVGEVHRRRTDPSGVFSVKLFWRDVEDLAAERDPAHAEEVSELDPGVTTAATYRRIADLVADVLPNPRFVLLSRQDRVRQAVSALAAEQTRSWRSFPGGAGGPARGELRYDRERIEQLLGLAQYSHDHWEGFFAALGVTPYRLTYEDLAADHDAAVRGVLRYLGSAAEPPEVRMLRQSSAATEALVLRFLRDPDRRV